jgi:type II secretory ATPase GspE/PulE/Tfp pilus assembly ATPase PilB-like protein
MNESHKATCKQCKEQYPKVFSYIEKNLTRRFRDDRGGLWQGKICPNCNRSNQRIKMAERARAAKASQCTNPTD